jgi:hypothetical protein
MNILYLNNNYYNLIIQRNELLEEARIVPKRERDIVVSSIL